MKLMSSFALILTLSFAVVALRVQRDEAQTEAAHYQRLAADPDNAALVLGEPWSIMHGAGTITRDLADGTASGWVGWLYNEDPLAPCIDGAGYVVCVLVKDVCRERP